MSFRVGTSRDSEPEQFEFGIAGRRVRRRDDVYDRLRGGDRPEDKEVKEKYEKAFAARYKQQPAIVGWNTYDCARVLFEAMKRGGTRGDSLRNEMAKLNIPGVFGRIWFRDDGSPIKDTEMFVVKGNKFVKLSFVDHAP